MFVRKGRKGAVAACLAVLGLAGEAGANTFDTFGFDPRALSMGGAQTADSRDFTSTYYNPSRLATLNKIDVGLGFTYAKLSLGVTPLDPAKPVTAMTPPDAANFSLGFVYPFAGKLQDKVAIGLGMAMPLFNLLKVQGVDPGTPAWYLYQSSTDRLQLYLGAGVRPFEWLAIGAGATVLADFSGDVQFSTDLFNKAFKRRDLVNELTNRASPVVGVSVIPFKWLSFGANWRAPMQLNFELPNNINLGDLGTLFLDVKGISFYTPHEFTVGARYDPLPQLTITADLEYAMWSKAPNPEVQVQVRLSGDLEKGLGLDQVGALDTHDPSPGFEDILIPRIGVEYRVVDRLAVRAGYFWRPTMVPKQNGDTNTLDGSVHAVSVGLGVNFADPLEILSDPILVDVVYQRGFVETRTAEKGTANPVNSYTYGGSTNVFSVAIRYNFGAETPKSLALEKEGERAREEERDEREKADKVEKPEKPEKKPKDEGEAEKVEKPEAKPEKVEKVEKPKEKEMNFDSLDSGDKKPDKKLEKKPKKKVEKPKEETE